MTNARVMRDSDWRGAYASGTETFSQELPLRLVEKSVEKIRVNRLSF
jgi:hypothetical protein